MLKRQNSTVRIDLRTVENSVLLMVEDHGCGINEHTLPHIFEKFYRGDKSRSFEGNGLGLALVKRIVALCQGEITVENKLHQGTSFTVKLANTNMDNLIIKTNFSAQ